MRNSDEPGAVLWFEDSESDDAEAGQLVVAGMTTAAATEATLFDPSGATIARATLTGPDAGGVRAFALWVPRPIVAPAKTVSPFTAEARDVRGNLVDAHDMSASRVMALGPTADDWASAPLISSPDQGVRAVPALELARDVGLYDEGGEYVIDVVCFRAAASDRDACLAVAPLVSLAPPAVFVPNADGGVIIVDTTGTSGVNAIVRSGDVTERAWTIRAQVPDGAGIADEHVVINATPEPFETFELDGRPLVTWASECDGYFRYETASIQAGDASCWPG